MNNWVSDMMIGVGTSGRTGIRRRSIQNELNNEVAPDQAVAKQASRGN